MKTKAIAKKWGNSLGLIIPNELIKKENIKQNDELFIDISKKQNIMHLFGSLKLKESAQQFKDELRSDEKRAWERKWKQLTKN